MWLMSSLQEAVRAVRDGSSVYWAFYCPGDAQAEADVVEVRLNATPESISCFAPTNGWVVNRVQWGDTLFLRREQSLQRPPVEDVLVEVLELADEKGMQLHSWLHSPALD